MLKIKSMKKQFILLGFLGLILIFTQCKKSESTPEKQTLITYPLTGLYGNNILNMADSINLDPTLSYSFAANLQADAALKIILVNLSIDPKAGWFYDSAPNIHWVISAYDLAAHQQTFTALSGGSSDLLLEFGNTIGKCRMDFYENNSQTPTKTKYFTWHS
jgi:hypothetical protein